MLTTNAQVIFDFTQGTTPGARTPEESLLGGAAASNKLPPNPELNKLRRMRIFLHRGLRFSMSATRAPSFAWTLQKYAKSPPTKPESPTSHCQVLPATIVRRTTPSECGEVRVTLCTAATTHKTRGQSIRTVGSSIFTLFVASGAIRLFISNRSQ